MTEARSVVVTGAARGIGQAVAGRFLAGGDKVATLSRSGQGPEGALNLAADIADGAQVSEAFAQIEAANGPVEVLVANAGITADGLLLRMSEDDFERVLNVNLTGTFRCVKAVTKGMIRMRRGRVLLLSSVVAMYGSAGQVNYAASKSALVGMARSIAREVGGRGITANVLAPGFIDTEMTAALPEARQEAYRQAIPAGRFGTVDDVAALAHFLASEEAGYINGAIVPVDGGLGMGH